MSDEHIVDRVAALRLSHFAGEGLDGREGRIMVEYMTLASLRSMIEDGYTLTHVCEAMIVGKSMFVISILRMGKLVSKALVKVPRQGEIMNARCVLIMDMTVCASLPMA